MALMAGVEWPSAAQYTAVQQPKSMTLSLNGRPQGENGHLPSPENSD